MVNPITEIEFAKIKELRKTKTETEVGKILNRSQVSVHRVDMSSDWADYVERKKVFAEQTRERNSLTPNRDAKIKGIKTLQARVLATFMSPEEYEVLLKKYNENRRGMGVELREKNFKIPLIKSEKFALLKYINLVPAQPIRELLGIGGIFVPEIGKIAVRFLYQNSELLKLEKLLDGGEQNG